MNSNVEKKKWYQISIHFLILVVLLVGVILWSITTGSIEISLGGFIQGLVTKDKDALLVLDLRLPRICIALLAGTGLSVAGTLLQGVLKNPLADPGIIGVSSGAKFAQVLILSFFPSLYFYGPMIATFGGILSFFLVLLLSGHQSTHSVRMILVGIAVAAMFEGLSQGLSYGFSQMAGGPMGLTFSRLDLKTWADVRILGIYVPVFLVFSFLVGPWCNILALEEKTILSLGIPVHRLRTIVAFIGVILASVATAIVGIIAFLALIVPHIGRKLVGNNYQVLLPYTALLGAFTFLLFDTLGRSILPLVEIPADILMPIIGGPIFIILLRREGKYGR